MTKYQWSLALRRRIAERLKAVSDPGHRPNVQDFYDALKAEDVATSYWRTELPRYIGWLIENAMHGYARTLTDSMAWEWRDACEALSEWRSAVQMLSLWRPAGRKDHAFIDHEAIDHEIDRLIEE